MLNTSTQSSPQSTSGKMSSRQGACIDELVDCQHQQLPYKLFALLRDRALFADPRIIVVLLCPTSSFVLHAMEAIGGQHHAQFDRRRRAPEAVQHATGQRSVAHQVLGALTTRCCVSSLGNILARRCCDIWVLDKGLAKTCCDNW